MGTQKIQKSLRCLLLALTSTLAPLSVLQAQHTIDTESRTAEEKQLLRTARNLHNRSRHHYDYGRYEEAIADITQARKIMEEVEGPDSPVVTTFINNLAYYYMAKGEFAPVESLLEEVVERNRKAHGDGSVEVYLAEIHLADFWWDRGLLDRAEGQYARTLERLEKSADERSVKERIPSLLRKLGAAHAERGALKEAEAYYQRALAVSEELVGKGHEATGHSINALALFYSRSAGRYEEAEALFREALALLEPRFGPSNEVWTVQENLGMCLLRSGKYEKAEELLKERYEFERGDPFLEQMGSPKLAHSASRLGELYWAMGKMDQAVPLWAEAGERYARHENATLAIGNEQERLVFAAGLVDNVNATISMHLQSAPESSVAAEMALMRVLRTKGRVVEAQADTYRTLRESLDFADKDLIQRLAELRGSIAYWTRAGEDEQLIADSRAELADIESALAEKSGLLADINAVVQVEELRAALPESAALVEFVRYQPYDVKAKEYGKPRYAAYLLTREGPAQGVDLGPAAAIEASVDGFRAALSSRQSLGDRSRNLHRSLVAPWLSKLSGKDHLILASDGLLNLLPFEVIQGSDGQPLLASHAITYLNCGRQLTGVGRSVADSRPSVVLGDPDYDGPAPEGEGEPAGDSSGTEAEQWPRLPGTAAEARMVHSLLPKSALLVEGEAREEALKAVDSPRILHIATHGYFLGASGESAPEAARGIVVVANQTKQKIRTAWSEMDNPLLRSGLVLAGANRASSGANDGRLTALEATGLDLLGTQLVVMSACETGVGEVTSGQGVFGLRRAMELAGAESQVLSLWQVSDEATTELMKLFYTGLAGGKSRVEALRAAQLELAKSEKWSHPYFWGAFILSGDWGPLR